MTREIIAVLRRELLDEAPSTPGGRPLFGEDLARELGYRKGWNDRARTLIARLGGRDIDDLKHGGDT